MSAEVHPYIKLRQVVRQAGKQFRRSDDNSASLFHPNGGFTYGYDMTKVDAALDEYEKSLPTEFLHVESSVSMESQLLRTAQEIVETSESMKMRDFARQVMAYLVIYDEQTLTTKSG